VFHRAGKTGLWKNRPTRGEYNERITVKRAAARSKNDDNDGTVRTVIVAAKVLDALAEFRGPVRLTELARVLKMTLPRISRHVSTLRALGFIEKAEPMEAYRLGTKLFVMGQIALEQNALANVAPPHLARLRDQIRRSVILSTRSGEGCVVLTCVPSNESPTIIVRPGSQLVLPNSPSARIARAFASTPGTSAEAATSDYVDERQNFILANYYDYETDTRASGIGSVAAPVFDHEDHLAGVVAVVMPSTALAAGPDPAIVKALMDCTARISSTMGSSAWDRRQSTPRQTGRRQRRG
jgi:IclR family transcriptional regulator, KDG regulon repressor